jgi:GTP-binding protein
VLLHLVDVSGASGRDPVEDFDIIVEELRRFSPQVAAKPHIVAANKIDAVTDTEALTRLEGHVRERGLPFQRISGVTGDGVEALLEAAWREIAAVRAASTEPPPEGEGTDLISRVAR